MRSPAFFQKSNALDLFLLITILAVAAWLRFEHLAVIPDGFHGDEAVSGLEGQTISRVGSIGPYSPLALGQPTGPLYLTALSLRLFGSTVWAVRAVSAFVGTLTVLVLYLMMRRHSEGTDLEKRTVALLGAALLATLHWHLYYSRIGFPIIVWPLSTLLAVWAGLEAAKRQQARWWSLTGLLMGLGIYVYNAQPACILMMGTWVVFHLVQQRNVAVVRRWQWFFSFCGMVAVTAVPMIQYALDPVHRYLDHVQQVSLFSAVGSPWPEMVRIGPRLGFLVGRYVDFWDGLSWHAFMNGGDGTSLVAVVPPGMLALALVGLVSSWRAKRGHLIEICLFSILLLPLGAIVTLDSANRRAFALAPFVALLAAVGVAEVYKWGTQREPTLSFIGRSIKLKIPHRAMPILLALLCGTLSLQNLYSYFVEAMAMERVEWIFAREMSETCRYLNSLPPNARVFFYSERWTCRYETRVFLAPNIYIEDHSKEFGRFNFDAGDALDKPYFVLLGRYKAQLPRLQKLYPHNRIVRGPAMVSGEPTFIALHPL